MNRGHVDNYYDQYRYNIDIFDQNHECVFLWAASGDSAVFCDAQCTDMCAYTPTNTYMCA